MPKTTNYPNDIPKHNMQIESLCNVYTAYVLPFISPVFYINKTRTSKTLRIILAACGEYIGAVDALSCTKVFSPVIIHAFDKYIDMHTKELYKSLVPIYNLSGNNQSEFFSGDIYDSTSYCFPNNLFADIVIVRNLSPELNDIAVLNTMIEALLQKGLLVITALSEKEGYAIKKTLEKELKEKNSRLTLRIAHSISTKGFLMNDEHIFVCERIS